MNNMKILIAVLMFQAFVSCAQNNNDTSQKSNTSEETTKKESSEAIAQKLDTKKFKEKLENTDGVLIDVRTTDEVKKGIIPGAKIIDYFSDQFEEKLLSFDKDKPVFVYCQSGGRSATAFDLLVSNGFQEVYELEGGMDYWTEDNLPTEKPNIK